MSQIVAGGWLPRSSGWGLQLVREIPGLGLGLELGPELEPELVPEIAPELAQSPESAPPWLAEPAPAYYRRPSNSPVSAEPAPACCRPLSNSPVSGEQVPRQISRPEEVFGSGAR